jgi:Rieske 2Fe-2S family protein
MANGLGDRTTGNDLTAGRGAIPPAASSPAARTAELERELETIRRPLEEATTLPGFFYTDPAIHQAEIERIFTKMWLCVGREEDLPAAGDYIVRDIGAQSVIVLRDRDGALRAFHNVCRHRGSRLRNDASGSGLKGIQCPYHAWTYELDGSLRAAPHMEDARNFDKRAFGLNPVRIDTWEGLVFVSLSADEPPLREFLGEMTTKFERYGIGRMRRGRRIVYDVASNWKILAENYSECYHCALIHPELNRLSHYTSGEIDLINQATVGGYMELRQDEFQSMTVSGHSARPPFPGIDAEDRRRIHYYIVFPNLLLSLHPDYVMTHVVWPQGPGRSEIVNEFLFAADEVAKPGFDPSDAVDFWDMTNRQDWKACELTQMGVASRGYDRGRLSSLEWMVHIFDNFVADRLLGRTRPTQPGRILDSRKG